MNEIFKVIREDYKAFVERFLPGAVMVEEEEYKEGKILKVYSNKTNKLLCAQTMTEEGNSSYYIFEYPEDDEWGPPIPKYKLELQTKEEVQAFFDALAKLRKQKDEGNI